MEPSTPVEEVVETTEASVAASDATTEASVAASDASSPTEQNFRNLIAQPSIDWDSVQWEKLSPQQQHVLKHRMLEEKHKGHEVMHLEMILIFFGSIIVTQLILVLWRTKHKKSYQAVTLLGLWLMPAFMSLGAGYVRMLVVWTLFSATSGYVMYKATRRRITGNTPRLVYRWFLFIHRASTVLGVVGYILMMLIFSGLIFVLKSNADYVMEVSLLLMFYGVYYGVLGRDIAEMCVDFMAASMTYTSGSGSLPQATLTSSICAVCEKDIVLEDTTREDGTPVLSERTYKLNCGHIFHEFCIRGWCIVGKKQTCPYCKEKVDLKVMFKNPWEKPHLLFGQMLDLVRYLVVWFPIIGFMVQGLYHVLQLE